MVEKAMNPKKRFINEEDTCILLQRYSAATVLALLNEVANTAEAKIDWEQLVEKTSTGISNAREYQMLWRHLAYGEALPAKFHDEAQPMEDDSDLEYELEAFPAAIGVASTEAAAGVKVLIAFGSPNDSIHGKGATVDAPLTLNVAKGPSSKSNKNSKPIQSMQRKKIPVPVSVQKQPPLQATTASVETAEGDDANGLASESMVSRKRKQRWSKADDSELIAAVKKRGENWITLSEEVFKGDRSPGQLGQVGQRWATFKKQNPDLNVKDNSIGKLSEAQLAARHSLSVALGTAGTHPFKKAAGTNAQSKVAGTNAAGNPLLNTATEAESQSQKGFKPREPYQKGLLGSTTKSRVASKNSITKLNSNNEHMVRAIAVAAGARIASPSDAASLLKAAQSKNAVHIMPTGGSSVPSSLHGEASPNLHHIRTGMAAMPHSTPPTTPFIPSAAQPGSFQSKQINGVRSSPGAEFILKQEAKTTQGSMISKLGCTPTKQVQDEEVQEVKVDSANQKGELKSLSTIAENVVGSLNIGGDDTGNKAVTSVGAEERHCVKENQIMSSLLNVVRGDPSAVQSRENQSTSVKQTDFESIVTDGCSGEAL